MKRYTIIVTRETTESAVLKVEAADATAAERQAMKLARTLNPLRWQVDDGVTPGEPYVTGNEEDSP